MPADTVQNRGGNASGGAPMQTQTTNPTPPQAHRVSPDLPTRHPNRVSRDNLENPVSPVDKSTNFSYPSRNNLRDPENETISGKPPGRLDNLKAAAVGLHVSC